MDNILETLNRFNIQYDIDLHIKSDNKEYLNLVLSLNGKTLDGRHKLSKLLVKYLNLNYKAYFIRGVLNIRL